MTAASRGRPPGGAALDRVTPEQWQRAGNVRLILVDSDGVLTDGRLYTGSDGSELRAFDAKDGHGIKMGQQAGLVFAILSGRRSPVVELRAAELGITEVHQRVLDKVERLQEILQRLGHPFEAACYIGDDLIDVPAMRRVGFAVAPADAMPEAIEAAHYVTERRGGRGAVRELIDLVLRASGRWDDVTGRYLEPENKG